MMQPNPWQVQAGMTAGRSESGGGSKGSEGIVRPARLSGALSMIMLGSWVGVALFVAYAQALRIRTLDELPDLLPSEMVSRVESSDSLVSFTSYALLGTTAVTAVLFCVWLFQARRNAERIADRAHRWSRPWVIFGWVVPIVSLWVPKQIVDDVWSASAGGGDVPRTGGMSVGAWKDAGDSDPWQADGDSDPWPAAAAPRRERGRRSWVVPAWWASWLVYLIGGRVLSRLMADAGGLEGFRDQAVAAIVVIVPGITAAVLAAVIIYRLNRMQRAEALRIAAAIEGPTAATAASGEQPPLARA